MLFLVATPIGNLADISLRALEVLKSADLILCEDTRHSLKLLNHYEISKPLKSYHKFNEQSQVEGLLEFLQEGKSVCMISDAGTPLISDPGYTLVQACIREKIEVTAIPGPCALIHALICSGLASDRFQFVGFLPKKEQENRKFLDELCCYPGVSIAYESPHRLVETLDLIQKINPLISVCIGRELTKKFETFLRGSSQEVLSQILVNPPKGECVLLIEGKKREADYSMLSIDAHVEEVQRIYNIPKREAIKIVAELRNLNKRELYRSMHLNLKVENQED